MNLLMTEIAKHLILNNWHSDYFDHNLYPFSMRPLVRGQSQTATGRYSGNSERKARPKDSTSKFNTRAGPRNRT